MNPFLAQDTLAKAARLYGCTVGDLKGPSRQRHVTRPRYAVMAALRAHGLSYPRIARAVGRSDHSTAIHGVKRAESLALRYSAFAEAVTFLTGTVASPVDRSDRDAAILEAARAGERTAAIAARFGSYREYVARLRRQHGIAPPPARPSGWLDCPVDLIETYQRLRGSGLLSAEVRAMLEKGIVE